MSDLRRRIVEAGGHVPSALSIVDIVDVLHNRVMRPSDRFVLSKGHGALALYAVTCRGEFDDIRTYPGHPERGFAGIECSTGSLGHGLPMAVGMAYAKRLKNESGTIFCLVGDTEMEEGSCWEAVLLAARFGLGNLMMIVDANGNSPNRIDDVPYETSLARKLQAFGWFVSMTDGHNHAKLARMLSPIHGSQPHAVIAATVKGMGVPAMMADPGAWHRRPASDTAPLADTIAV